MKHFKFYFNVSFINGEECKRTKGDTKMFGIDDIIKWYTSIIDMGFFEPDNICVQYDYSRHCFVLEFDFNGSVKEARFMAELIVDPDDDGNYPIVSMGRSWLICGELI